MIYLASPYTDPSNDVMHKRYLAACKACAELLIKGETVYSPIVHWHNIAHMYQLPKDFNAWMNIDCDILKLASKLIILKIDGWNTSKGVSYETTFAKENNIPIEYMEIHDGEVNVTLVG